MSQDDMWAELPPRPKEKSSWDKLWLPELNPPQRKLLTEKMREIIGDDIDTQALVQAKEREKAKHAFTVNETKEAQRLRLCKAFGIEIPEMSHRELREWLKELR